MSKARASEISIIRTKLAPPRIGSAPVRREELLRRLDARRDSKLGLVLGPAGSGKTMLLAQWRRQLIDSGAKVAWYNLGVDDDVTQVGAYIIESLRSAKVEVRTDELLFFTRSGGKSRHSFLASLIDDLIDCEDEIYLIIDDLHHGTAFNIFQLLDALLDNLPDNVHLVFGSRSRPPLSLLKLQTQDQLAEIDFKDLRFDIDETGRFVAAQGLIDLDQVSIRRLHEMSDGWAAGLQLLLFSLRKESRAEHFFERHASQPLVSQESALVDYLESTVADYIAAEELDFLTSISVCRRFNRSLCEVLTDNPRAGELLRKFESEQLFLLPIDTPEVDPWYRFHRLFEGFLHSRLERRARSDVQALYAKAARWFAQHRLHIEALRYAGESGDNELLADLIDRSARRLSGVGQFRQLIKWCGQVPKETLRNRLNINLNLAWAQVSCGHFDAFQENLKDILQSETSTADASVSFEIQLLRAYGCGALDDTAGITAILEPLSKEKFPEDAFLLSLISGVSANAHGHAGHFAEAREAVRSFYKHFPRGASQHQHLLADAVVGEAYLSEGRIRDALAHLMPFKEKIVLGGKVGPDVLANLTGPLCDALFQFNRLSEARELINAYAEVMEMAELPGGILSGYRVRAHLESAAGDAHAAFQTMRRLEEVGSQRRLDRLVSWSLYEQLILSAHHQILTSRDEILHRLGRLADKYRDQHDCAWAQIPMLYALAAAENAVHYGRDYDDCQRLIDIAEDHAKHIALGGILTRLGFMRCIAKFSAGLHKQAVAEAGDLLGSAAELGAMRSLADLGPIALPLVRQMVGRTSCEQELIRIALGEASTPDQVGKHMSEHVGGLTGRERDVLNLLGKGFSAKSIGRNLDISATTAKWHLKNVYAKLEAVSREDALAKARQHGLIT